MWIPKIIIVDDEKDISETLGAFFGRRGYEVLTASGGSEALKLISCVRPELVLLDMTLDGMSGRDVLLELRKSDPVTKVIVLTGQSFDQAQLVDLMNLGVIDVLSKPVSLHRLEELVAQMIRGSVFAGGLFQPQDPGACLMNFHQISNSLGIIRNLCEAYILDAQEGFHREKSAEQLNDESLRVMKSIIENVDRISERLSKDQQLNKEGVEGQDGR